MGGGQHRGAPQFQGGRIQALGLLLDGQPSGLISLKCKTNAACICCCCCCIMQQVVDQPVSADAGAGLEAVWESGSIELHHEIKEGPFRHGAPLGGCVASMAPISNAQPADHNHWRMGLPKDCETPGDQR